MGIQVTVLGLLHDGAGNIFLTSSDKFRGKYGLPGGKPESYDGDEIATLRREIRQELGIEITDIVQCEEITLAPTKDIDGETTFVVRPYIARVESTSVRPNAEIGNHGWYGVSDALALDLLGPIRTTIERYQDNFRES